MKAYFDMSSKALFSRYFRGKQVLPTMINIKKIMYYSSALPIFDMLIDHDLEFESWWRNVANSLRIAVNA